MVFLLGCLTGLFVGVTFMWIMTKKPESASGTFCIDFSDPMKDVCTLKLEQDINDIYNKERIVLNVETHK